jgi:hypothetical protein
MREKKEYRFIIAGTESGANLSIYCRQKGFRLVLDCGDGVSIANGGFYNWHNIVLALYSKDPDMFGRLIEPMHFIFPKLMHSFGFKVPPARVDEVMKNLGYTWLDEKALDKVKFIRDVEELLLQIQMAGGNNVTKE